MHVNLVGPDIAPININDIFLDDYDISVILWTQQVHKMFVDQLLAAKAPVYLAVHQDKQHGTVYEVLVYAERGTKWEKFVGFRLFYAMSLQVVRHYIKKHGLIEAIEPQYSA